MTQFCLMLWRDKLQFLLLNLDLIEVLKDAYETEYQAEKRM